MEPRKNTKKDKPKILQVGKADKSGKPNTCRACAGSKFC